VIKLMGYLGMDVESMTTNDWLGVFFAVFVFVAMIYVYFLVLRPANKDKFESQRSMALDDDDPINAGEK
jgi:cytochrome c oxidase cbb3-type subunit IV